MTSNILFSVRFLWLEISSKNSSVRNRDTESIIFGSTDKSILCPGVPVKGGNTVFESSCFHLTSNYAFQAALSAPPFRLEEVDSPRIRMPLL